MSAPATDLLQRLAGIDPSPLFVLSLLPYLAFLWWAARLRAFPRLALRGFQLTLLFVAVTIAAAIVAETVVGRQLADVDPLHGGAEAFLTLSNLLVVLGFVGATRLEPRPAAAARTSAAAEGSGSSAAGPEIPGEAPAPGPPNDSIPWRSAPTIHRPEDP